MKHLLSLTDLTKNDINQILEVATQMRRVVLTNYKKGPQLMGSMVAGVWDAPCASSTAFSLATQYLSGSFTPVFGADDMQNHCSMLANMGVNTLVVSCPNDNLAKTLSNRSRCSIVNGGSSQFDPIGVLADLLALQTKLDGLSDLSVLTVGNKQTNKLTELNHCLQMFGSSVVWYLPADDLVTPRKGIVLDNPQAAFANADAIIDLGLSQFSAPEKYYGSIGGIPTSLVNKARINCPLLGCQTVVEDFGIKEYAHNIVATQQSCYVSVAMAVLYLVHRN